MNSSITDHKISIDRLSLLPAFVIVSLVLACFALSPSARAVSPAPDGGYPNRNTAEGDEALLDLTSGTDNTAVGSGALLSNTSGNRNTATGSSALDSSTTGSDNTAIGFQALAVNSMGASNTANGSGALLFNKTGNNNTATGFQALASNSNGSDNTAVGYSALFNNGFDGIDNTAVGSGALASNVSGGFNTAVGFQALVNSTASNNTAVGDSALSHNINGTTNTATGIVALFKNTSGNQNTADGADALFSNTTGSNNTADGFLALENNGAGHDNTAQGFQALKGNTTGNNNIALGSNAGGNLTTGGNNIDIGAPGNSGEANIIRIGKQGTQKQTFIAGISGVPVTGSTVVVNSTGKLGVATSSARFKKAIKPMDKVSEAILTLKPVSFRYNTEIDPDGIPQFGLIAEEVEKVNPDLVGRDENGKVNTVRYEAVNAMLLNEFLKAHRDLQELKATVAEQRKQIETLAATVQTSQGLVQPRHAGTANGPE
jgi:hypothetical protein